MTNDEDGEDDDVDRDMMNYVSLTTLELHLCIYRIVWANNDS